MNGVDLSIVIPVFRAGNILRELIDKIDVSLKGSRSYEVLLVCDKCDPVTENAANELSNKYHNIRIFRLKRNYGQHKALLFGFLKSSGDFIITMDEDLQHNPDDIHKLINKQVEGDYDIVYGSFSNPGSNWIRNKISSMSRRFLSSSIPGLYEKYSPFRLIRSNIAVEAAGINEPYVFIDDFLSRITTKTAHVNVCLYSRPKGSSSYSGLKVIRHGLLVILKYSRLASFLFVSGIITLLAGLFVKNAILAIAGLVISVPGICGYMIIFIHQMKNSEPVTFEA